MDAFLIVSVSGVILVERYYKNNSNRSWINDYISTLCAKTTLSPLAHHETLHPIVLNNGKAYFQILRNDVLLIGITAQEFPSVLLIETLHQVADNLGQHFDHASVSEQLIKSHYSSVLSLIDEMLDYGLPSILEPNALQMLVVEPSPLTQALDLLSPTRFMANVIGTASSSSGPTSDTLAASDSAGRPGYGMGVGSGMGAGSGLLGSGSSIWWRRGAGGTVSNEVFVDLVERLSCCVDRNGKVLSSYLTGDITINSGLSGIPMFKLILKGLETMKQQPVLSFHPSVNRQKWSQDQTLNFVPPDGLFTVCRYSMNTDLSPPLNVIAQFSFSDPTSVQDSTVVKVYPTPSSDIVSPGQAGGPTGRFKLLLQARQGFGVIGGFGSGGDLVLENVRLSILLPRWVVGITTAQVSVGSVKFNDRQKTMTWSFGRFPLDTKQNPECDGTFTIDARDRDVGQARKRPPPVNNPQQQTTTATTAPVPREALDKEDDSTSEQGDNFVYGESHFPPATTTHTPADKVDRNAQYYPSPSTRRLDPSELTFPAFLTFWLPHRTLSNLTIDSLQSIGTEQQLYAGKQATSSISKMVRCATTAGKIEFRL